eukprot:jgi/Psemu1/301167/fgenesh1_kg.26_\
MLSKSKTSIAVAASCMFSYCIITNTPEAEAFSQVRTPVASTTSSGTPQTRLAEMNGRNAGRVAHSPACLCSDCAKTHGSACPCTACSRARHGVGCECESCKL